MIFYKKTGTLPSLLAAPWCICCFQLAWWHPFSESRCCPLLHWCNSGITPLTSVKWLQIYPWQKQNWTTVSLSASLLWSSGQDVPVLHHKVRVSACLLCCAWHFCVLDTPTHVPGWSRSQAALGRAWPPHSSCWMEHLLALDPWPLSTWASSCLDMFPKEFFKLKKCSCNS